MENKKMGIKSRERSLTLMKMNIPQDISYEEAKEIIKGTDQEFNFLNLAESTSVQNQYYSITKVKRKGTLLHKGSEYEVKCDEGVFVIEVCYDYKHPTNFVQDEYNICATFTIGL